MLNTEEIKIVYKQLKNREIHPSGTFDKANRWYADNSELVSHIRSPSRAYPFSEMIACRTLKYVKAVSEKFNCETIEQLRDRV